MEIYEKISYLRKKKNITQSDLASLLDVSRQTVYKWEAGITSPDINKLPAIAEIFNVSVDYLLSGEEEEVTEKQETINRPKRSMLDYLLMIPCIVGIFILIFMFYTIGGIFLGLIIIFEVIAILSPAYSILLMCLNSGSNIVISLSFMIMAIGAIYPIWILFKWYLKFYKKYAKRIYKRIKSFNWRSLV